MPLLTVGFNHQTAPLSLRERIAFPTGEAVRSALAELRPRLPGSATEAAILSTCNRTEIYCSTDDPVATGDALFDWFNAHSLGGLSSGATADAQPLSSHLYALPDQSAVNHAFRVACGLDSMVLGEPQILGQMKEAARLAQSSQTLGTHLHQLFQRSFSVAKEVRSRTAIGAQSVSMAAASVRLAQRIFERLDQCSVLLIGAGEMIELCAAHWRQNCRELVVANRTVERASRLASRFDAGTMPLTNLSDNLSRFDVVLSCTASSLPIVGLGMVERAVRKRRHRPMLMIDLAVPRDIEEEVQRLQDVYLYTVDDLRELVDAGLEERRAAVVDAERIIAGQVGAFMDWMRQRSFVPMIRDLHQRGDALRQAEVERAKRMLARGEDPAAVVEALSVALTNKFLHGSTSMLSRQAGDDPRVAELIQQLLPRPRR